MPLYAQPFRQPDGLRAARFSRRLRQTLAVMGILKFFDRNRPSKPMVKSAFMRTITLETFGNVVVEDRGEHHMGASTVVVALPSQLSEYRELFTTNGTAFYSAETRSLFVHDACVLLRFRLDSLSVSHWMPKRGFLIGSINANGEILSAKIYEPASSRECREIAVTFQEFSFGMGPVKKGRFPSAYP